MTVARFARFALLLVCWPLVSQGEDSLRAVGVDAECEQQYTAASAVCSKEGDPAMKSCFQRRLSAECAAQANAPPAVPRDASCQKEFKAASGPCGKELVDAINRCTQNRLSTKCRAQITVASQKAQQMLERCQEEMKHRAEQLGLCLKLPTTQDQNKCLDSMKKDDTACNR
jgi:hypothetical protein